MKFKKDGKVFDDIEKAREYYCLGRECNFCAILPENTCKEECENAPQESALKMGFEVIEDEDEIDISSMTLAQAKEYCYMHYGSGCRADGTDCVLAKCGVCGEIVHLWDIEYDLLTPQELEICRAVGAKWITRDTFGKHPSICLWNGKPYKDESANIYFVCHDKVMILASVDESIFRSIKPGDCICVEELLNNENQT